MSIAPRLRWYLEAQGVRYELVPHPHSASSAETARGAAVPPETLAKPVLLEDEQGYVMALVPASCRVDLRSLSEQLNRELTLAGEREMAPLFHDCEQGALPALGSPYRIPTVYDDALAGLREVCFEAGDHEDVVRMAGAEFVRLLAGARHGRFSVPL